MRHLFLILATVGVCLTASAQTKFLPNAPEAKRVAEGVVARFAAGNFPGAWNEMRQLSVAPPSEFDAFEAQFSSQAGDLLRRFGSSLGYEFISEQALGTSLVRYQFLIRHEKAPMRWYFIFYRSEKGWVLTDFKFDGNTAALFP